MIALVVAAALSAAPDAGTLPKAPSASQIVEAIVRRREDIKRCVWGLRERNGRAYGTLNVTFDISPRGECSATSFAPSGTVDDEFLDCMRVVISETVVARTRNGAKGVVFPFKY